MKLSAYTLLVFPLLLSACSVGHRPAFLASNSSAAGNITINNQYITQPPPSATEVPAELPNVALNERLLFQFLLGDIAVQRGKPELAAQAYWELAKATRDPRVARRAAQLALETRQIERSLEAFALWQELEPAAPLANQMLVSLLLSGGKFAEAKPQVQRMLAANPQNTGQRFMLVHSLLSRAPDKTAALEWIKEIAQPYPQVAEAHWAVAQIAAAANNKMLALTEIRQAVQLQPHWDLAVMFEAQLLLPQEAAKALALLKKFLETHPDNKDLRLFYARALLEQKHYAESRIQFRILLDTNKSSTELAFAVALLSLQMGELERAEKELQETLLMEKRDASTVHYYLAQLNEAKKDDVAALRHYQLVLEGEFVFSARLREAYLLSNTGKLAEARSSLKKVSANSNQQRVTLTLVEAQLLRDEKLFIESYQVLADALEKLPNHPQLLFEMAMAADKLGKLELFEQNLRKLIQLAPDHAQAYNALGYSLLDRNIRLDEGMLLVEKAYQLAPDDAAITDSVGWGYFRLGKLDKSAEFLNRAFILNPDPEIASHLGEVLWAQGNKVEAEKILKDTLQHFPDSEILRAAIKKYFP
ncbi:MAG: tetratricopeptide repeat protein [Gallionellaceae bacterium]|jgi:tetratricopeptide (TPR) repeat protein